MIHSAGSFKSIEPVFGKGSADLQPLYLFFYPIILPIYIVSIIISISSDKCPRFDFVVGPSNLTISAYSLKYYLMIYCIVGGVM